MKGIKNIKKVIYEMPPSFYKITSFRLIYSLCLYLCIYYIMLFNKCQERILYFLKER